MKKQFELWARSEVLQPFRKELRQILSSSGWNTKTTDGIVLAVDEALTNIIRHAYKEPSGKIKVQIEDDPEKTEIILEDTGFKFDPTCVTAPELPRHKPGGLGIHFIRTMMDQIIYDADYKEGNRLRLIKRKKP